MLILVLSLVLSLMILELAMVSLLGFASVALVLVLFLLMVGSSDNLKHFHKHQVPMLLWILCWYTGTMMVCNTDNDLDTTTY